MKPDPLISVITVCYNSDKTITRALQSVADQKWPRIEHIVVDGASIDKTLHILDKFRLRLAKVISEPDHGIYDAMNKGLDCANGDIVCFLNSDDYYTHPLVLSSVARHMHEYNLDALMGDVVFFNQKNPLRIIRRYRSKHFNPSRLVWGEMPAHPALFLCRPIIQRVGHFKTDYSIAGDFEYIIRVFYNQSLRYQHINDVMVSMQLGGVSTNGLRSKILLNKEVLRACRENGLDTNIIKILFKYPAKILEYFQK